MSENNNKPSLSILSNKRLKEIKTELTYIKDFTIEDKLDDIINIICQVMKFSPDYSKYRVQNAKLNAEKLGISMYKYLQQDKYYKKNKDIKKNTQIIVT
jgi:hypothetical protein